MTPLLSETMIAALNIAKGHGGKLLRHPGGYWSFDGCPRDHNGVPHPYFGTTTLQGLVARGRMRWSKWQMRVRRQPDAFPIEAEICPAEQGS